MEDTECWMKCISAFLHKSGSKSLCEIENNCSHSNHIHGKLSDILIADDRFVVNGNIVSLTACVAPVHTPYIAATPINASTTMTVADDQDGCSKALSTISVPDTSRIIRGHDWTDVSFTDQTEMERAVFVDTRNNHAYKVRGASYLRDGIKSHTGPALFRLLLSEFIEVETEQKLRISSSPISPTYVARQRYDHIATLGRVKQRLDALRSICTPEPPQILVINYQYPGNPPVSHLVIFIASPDINKTEPGDSATEIAAKTLWINFKKSICETEDERRALFPSSEPSNTWLGSMSNMLRDTTWDPSTNPGVYPANHFTNRTLKVIPRIVGGNWAVRKALPANKPCLLGQKVQLRYFKGVNYVEIDVDIGSSVIASNIMGAIRGAAKMCTLGYALVLQGTKSEELPEKVLACHDGNKADFAHMKSLNDPIVSLF